MKAHINGILVEGTPEEIAAYQRIKAEEARQPFKEPRSPYVAQIMDPGAVERARQLLQRKCPNEGHPCNCIGACM